VQPTRILCVAERDAVRRRLAAESKALWKLGFKQSSFHHIAQVLRRDSPSVRVVHRFTSMLLSSRPFGLKSTRWPSARPLKCRLVKPGIPQCAAWRTCVFGCGTHAARTCARGACAKSRSLSPTALSYLPSYLVSTSIQLCPRQPILWLSQRPLLLGQSPHNAHWLAPTHKTDHFVRALVVVTLFRLAVVRRFRPMLSTRHRLRWEASLDRWPTLHSQYGEAGYLPPIW
jgi:hypothetical protein